jgi:hypothetical protein
MIDNRNTAPSAMDHLKVGTFFVDRKHAGSCLVLLADPCFLCYFIEVRTVWSRANHLGWFASLGVYNFEKTRVLPSSGTRVPYLSTLGIP